jgi:hypothetical protein
MAFSSKRWRLAGGALYVDGVQYFPHGEIDIHTGMGWRTPTLFGSRARNLFLKGLWHGIVWAYCDIDR